MFSHHRLPWLVTIGAFVLIGSYFVPELNRNGDPRFNFLSWDRDPWLIAETLFAPLAGLIVLVWFRNVTEPRRAAGAVVVCLMAWLTATVSAPYLNSFQISMPQARVHSNAPETAVLWLACVLVAASVVAQGGHRSPTLRWLGLAGGVWVVGLLCARPTGGGPWLEALLEGDWTSDRDSLAVVAGLGVVGTCAALAALPSLESPMSFVTRWLGVLVLVAWPVAVGHTLSGVIEDLEFRDLVLVLGRSTVLTSLGYLCVMSGAIAAWAQD